MEYKLIHFNPRFRNIFFSLALLVIVVSCNPDDEDFVSQPVDVAYVSIYHAAPNAPALDIAVDGRLINRDPLEYTGYSGYLNFFTGTREIKFHSANANSAVIDTTFNFEDGKAYSLFAINTASDVEALLVVDSAAAPAAGKAMVRFINLAPDAPAFDLTHGTDSVLFSGNYFKGATPFQEVVADTYSFQIRDAGASKALITAEDVEILPGRFYTVITRGFLNPPNGNSNILSLEVIE